MTEYVRGDLINENNRDVELGQETDEPCPTCQVYENGKPKFKLFVRSDLEGTKQLECKNCGHLVNVPS